MGVTLSVGPVTLQEPLQVWLPTDRERIVGPPPPYLLAPLVGDPMTRIEQLQRGAELMQVGFQLFHSSTTAMGGAGVIQDGGDHGHNGDQWRSSRVVVRGECRVGE